MKNKFHYIIPFYEIIGGVLGVISTLIVLYESYGNFFDEAVPASYRVIFIAVIVAMMGLYVLSFISGMLLWRDKKSGYVMSIIVQVFQLPYIVTSPLIYTFISGAQLGVALNIGADLFKLNFLAYIGSTFTVYFANKVDGFAIGVNILSVIIIRYLYVCLFREKEDSIKTETIIAEGLIADQPEENKES